MIVLRPLREGDKDQMLAWRNSPEVAQYMYSDHVISADEHERWFSRVLLRPPTSMYWIIEVDGRGIGVVNLVDINRSDKRCSWAFYIADPAMRGSGVGPALEFAVLEYVFNRLGIEKLCCEVLEGNEAVVNLHKKLGFQQEGHLRQQVIKGGQRRDVHVLGMLTEDWVKLRDSPLANRLRGKVSITE